MISIRELDTPYQSNNASGTTVATPSCCCCCCCCLATAVTAPVLAGRVAWKASVERTASQQNPSAPTSPSWTWTIIAALFPIATIAAWVVLAVVGVGLGDTALGPVAELLGIVPPVLSVGWLGFAWHKAGVSTVGSILGSVLTHIGMGAMAGIELALVIGGAFLIYSITQENAAASWTIGLALWALAAACCVWLVVKVTKPKPLPGTVSVRGSQQSLSAPAQGLGYDDRPPLIADYQSTPGALPSAEPGQNISYQPISQDQPAPTPIGGINPAQNQLPPLSPPTFDPPPGQPPS